MIVRFGYLLSVSKENALVMGVGSPLKLLERISIHL